MTTELATTTRERYNQAIPELCKEFDVKNQLAAPRITKVCLSMGVGRAIADGQILNVVTDHLTQLAGQRAVVTKARKSIAQFRSREDMKIGCRVTLRRDNMWNFLDRLIHIAIPRIRDFRGISPKGFDKQGNFSMGLGEQALFPEVVLDRIEHNQGLNITIVIENSDKEKSLSLLKTLGMPLQNR